MFNCKCHKETEITSFCGYRGDRLRIMENQAEERIRIRRNEFMYCLILGIIGLENFLHIDFSPCGSDWHRALRGLGLSFCLDCGKKIN